MTHAAPPSIEVDGLRKRYGRKVAVDDLSFTVRPGSVTGFLGPNGAGKSTTMRLILGLDHANAGTALIGGRPYRELRRPLCTVGALLEAKAVHKGRSAYHHLLWLAQTQGIGEGRVRQVIDQVGLADVAHRRTGGFSLGMGQRVGIAAALLGDPQVLLLDEPVNGLDPEGVLWIRNLLKDLAAQGRAVLVSSHLMNEMAVTADHLVVIGRGRLISDCSTGEFIRRYAAATVRVRTRDGRRLAELVVGDGGEISGEAEGAYIVSGLDADRIAELASPAGVVLHELSPQHGSLEAAFMELTRESVEYGGTAPDRSRA
ncbi:ATP-binding cassette domain-containing protein [Actinoplanes sp. NPDC026623]|uniref:ABC transporter ATP-binding protein n=1 Tax=Actinoplanes sp. NPDC026623 TaxID=3155610 RepID=UPI00340B1382